MTRVFAHRLLLFAAVLTVALASVAFAARMAPDRAGGASLDAYLAMGGTLDELCAGGDTPQHAHHCPVCHLLPEGARVRLTPAVRKIARGFGIRPLRELAQHPQRGDPHRVARAPPVFI